MPNIALSETNVKALRPRQSAYDVRDVKLKGFGVRVLPSGAARFFIHVQHRGKRIWKIVGKSHIIPVQAKVGSDRIGVVQIIQDIGFVNQKFSGMRCRAIAAQFMRDRAIALFELALQDDAIRIVEERHYRLVPADRLDDAAIRDYRG